MIAKNKNVKWWLSHSQSSQKTECDRSPKGKIARTYTPEHWNCVNFDCLMLIQKQKVRKTSQLC